jgi:hypothetical protein
MGEKLLKDVTEATGLPEELISNELAEMLRRAGHSPETLTMEGLRKVMADYLQDVLLGAKEFFDEQSEKS